ncbi:Cytochrome c oxidase polypeptide II [Richelia intracellularis]|nr:Cytochrome c oxidase polypeptide II [Richelia intracellularis]
MGQIPVSLLTLVVGIMVTAFSIWLGQHHNLLPVQASQQAPLVDGFFNIMFTIAIVLFVLVEGTILLFLIKYRRRRGDNTDGFPIEGSFPLEVFWTAIPAFIVIVLGVYSVDVYGRMGGLESGNNVHGAQVAQTSETATAAMNHGDGNKITKPPEIGIGKSPIEQAKLPDLEVNVTGMQFAWLFNYPESGVTMSELHVPIGADVQLNIAATDVIHSLWVPQFRIKQDAIPGMTTRLRFVATKPGTYPIVCTELCGGYHGSMRSQVVVETADEFASWLKESQIAQNKADASTTLAMNPAGLSNSDFLSPHTQKMGVNPATIAQLQK